MASKKLTKYWKYFICKINDYIFTFPGETVRAGRPDVRRVRRRALRLQVCALLLRERHLLAGIQHTHTHTRTHTHVHKHAHIQTHKDTHAQTHTHKITHRYTSTHLSTRTHTPTLNTSTHARTHTHTIQIYEITNPMATMVFF